MRRCSPTKDSARSCARPRTTRRCTSSSRPTRRPDGPRADAQLIHQAIALDWSRSDTVAGTFLEIHALGVLLTGDSGVGKSELALELVSRGHRLIADDVVEVLRPAPDFLVARCPELLRDFLETRALGVLNLRRLYGDRAIAPMQRLDLVVQLDAAAGATDADRVSGSRATTTVLEVPVPQISMRARLGHNLRALVEAACRDHWLRLFGYRSDEDFSARQAAAIQKGSSWSW